MKGIIALALLLVGGAGLMLTSGPLEGIRGIFAVIGAIGASYLLGPRGKR